MNGHRVTPMGRISFPLKNSPKEAYDVRNEYSILFSFSSNQDHTSIRCARHKDSSDRYRSRQAFSPCLQSLWTCFSTDPQSCSETGSRPESCILSSLAALPLPKDSLSSLPADRQALPGSSIREDRYQRSSDSGGRRDCHSQRPPLLDRGPGLRERTCDLGRKASESQNLEQFFQQDAQARPENVGSHRHGREQLKHLLELNEVINIVLILKDKLKHIWSYKSRTWATKAIEEWCALARCTEHPSVQKFADTLERYSYGILNHCDYPIHTGKLEGVNNKIKVIKRKAYGYHDLRYFSLKIIQAFTN